MNSQRPITIVGGGLAGLALGIALRRQDVPVTIREAGHYPRHRVCGEFISGRGQHFIEALGLSDCLRAAGAVPARTARFVAGSRSTPMRPLSVPALCVSRFDLDFALANRFTDLGGDLQQNARWTGTFVEGIVRASGRRPTSIENGWRWFGLKAHAENVHLDADLEMHVVAGGYVGMNRINHGEVNVCGLFRSRPSKEIAPPESLLRGTPGSSLHQRLESARFVEASFCSVAGLGLKPRRAAEWDELCLGDALTMTPPVTGNGMSMAFESAELACAPLTAYSRGELNWSETCARVARACDAAFAARLKWAARLQWLMFSPLLRSAASRVVLESESIWRMFWHRTR